MIQLDTYTKEEMADELGYNTDKASNITKRLTNLGYKFITSGRGNTYRIKIVELPQYSIKDFANDYLGISARFDDRLTHFLYLLFSTGSDFYVNMSASSLEWMTPSCNDTIQDWLESLIDCGLLLEEQLIEVYYATQNQTIKYADYNSDYTYTYTQICKEITLKEYEKAISAYSAKIKSYGDISKNTEVAFDEAIYEANKDRKEALGGWWAKRKTANFKLVINKEWPQYNQLLSLLDDYEFVPFVREKTGNLLKDEEEWRRREQAWEEEKAEKRRKLNNPDKEEVVEEIPVVEEVELYQLRDFSDMPIFTDVREALIYLRDNFIYTGGLTEYVEEC